MLRADERPLSEHPCYFRGITVRCYTVPIVEKFVERAKAVHESTQGHRPYRTAKTAVRPTLAELEKIDLAINVGQ